MTSSSGSAFGKERRSARVVAIADLHGHLPQLPEGDVLLIGGDSLPVWDHDEAYQREWAYETFGPWLNAQPFGEIVGIAGNHDWLFQSDPDYPHTLPWTYLADETVTVAGLTIHGSPWANRFGDWAFMRDENELAQAWALIPDAVDVLLVHGPPFGACDLTERWGNEHVGSKTLRAAIVAKKPRYVVTGHIHEAYGRDRIGGSEVVNCSHVTVDYEPLNEAVTLDDIRASDRSLVGAQTKPGTRLPTHRTGGTE